ncbi:MAG: hypothetical protein JMDDDDMK_03097 [Acidobacteria bacterium]|nr:hypothetical protein [Acidobacteriota bacterium]
MHHTVPAEAVGEEQPFYAGRFADDRVVVGRNFVHPGPALLRIDRQINELRNAVYRARQNLFQKIVCEGGLETISLLIIGPRHQDRFAFAAEMKAGGHINHHRELRGQKIASLRFDYLPAQRRDGQFNPGHRCDACRPRPSGVDHIARRDFAACCLHSGHRAVFNVDACDFGVEPDSDAAFFGAFGEPGQHAVRINEAVGRAISAADDVVSDHLRNHLHDLVARNHLGVLQSERPLLLLVFAQVFQMRFGRRAEQIAVSAVIRRVAGRFFKTREEVNRIERHLDVDRRSELSAHAAHALAGRTESLLLFAFDDQNVRTARFGQVISDARSDDSAADDYDLRCFCHCALPSSNAACFKTSSCEVFFASSSATMRPRRITRMRSAIPNNSGRSDETITMLAPASASSLISR